MLLSLETLKIFQGKISENGNLYFLGFRKNSWTIIYRDGSSLETKSFYQIINHFGDLIIHNIYCFRYILEAMLFLQNKHCDYLRNSLIIITASKNKKEIKSFLFIRYIQKNLVVPKIHLFHSLRNFELTVLYLELLDKGVVSETIQLKGQNYLKIKYKSIQIILDTEQQTKSKILFLLGINDKIFKIRNYDLSHLMSDRNLYW